MNIPERLERLARIVGVGAVERLAGAHMLIIGLGGVGGACVEALARSGVGRLTLIDGDAVSESNLNRQIIATKATLGMNKAEAWAARIGEIAPDASVNTVPRRLGVDEVPGLIALSPDIVIDAIDDVPVKAALAIACARSGLHEIVCLGMGNRLDPAQVAYGDLFEVTHDPLARALRRRIRGEVRALRVVYSRETPNQAEPAGRTPGSSAFVPNAAGLALASDAARFWMEAGRTAWLSQA